MAMAMSSTSIFLTWDPPPIHERNGIITTYTINRVLAGTSSTHTTTALTMTFNNLRPFTTYTLMLQPLLLWVVAPLLQLLQKQLPQLVGDMEFEQVQMAL